MPVDDTAERALLLGRLTGQREHVIHQLEGLTDDQLRRPVLPSGWSCLALVRHLTLSDERYWFEVVVAGEPLNFWPDATTATGASTRMSRLRELWRLTTRRSTLPTRSSPLAA